MNANVQGTIKRPKRCISARPVRPKEYLCRMTWSTVWILTRPTHRFCLSVVVFSPACFSTQSVRAMLLRLATFHWPVVPLHVSKPRCLCCKESRIRNPWRSRGRNLPRNPQGLPRTLTEIPPRKEFGLLRFLLIFQLHVVLLQRNAQRICAPHLSRLLKPIFSDAFHHVFEDAHFFHMSNFLHQRIQNIWILASLF